MRAAAPGRGARRAGAPALPRAPPPRRPLGPRPHARGHPLRRTHQPRLRGHGRPRRGHGLVAALEPAPLRPDGAHRARPRHGVRIALGSHWSPTGSKNLLGELEVARLASRARGGLFADDDLVAIVTRVPAQILGWDAAVGTLAAGRHADLMVVRGDQPFASLLVCPGESPRDSVATAWAGARARTARHGMLVQMAAAWHVGAFLDWDTVRRMGRVPDREDASLVARHADHVFRWLRGDIASILRAIDASAAFFVNFRIYHGWHRGSTPTVDRRALESVRASGGAGGRIDRVAFDSDLGFGNELLCGGHRAALFDTLRRRPDGEDEQKMVDTALAADLLDFARREKHLRYRAALVVGDDDDLLPAAVTAEQWGLATWVVRRRQADNPHLRTAGLIRDLRLGIHT
ncbi:MAG: amidohydrolase family protein [Deltaproteobacteria bacterium]|nr:amidohydrolase family protein [Deltaproteobacteria bacterium]